ncbi:MAG TPA: hypothetical protein PLR96_04535 [Flavobacteriales bacterium]|mgnify:CR=1 FL=1|nr:hypothetical protein [Flavobacteriales bacterium]
MLRILLAEVFDEVELRVKGVLRPCALHGSVKGSAGAQILFTSDGQVQWTSPVGMAELLVSRMRRI